MCDEEDVEGASDGSLPIAAAERVASSIHAPGRIYLFEE